MRRAAGGLSIAMVAATAGVWLSGIPHEVAFVRSPDIWPVAVREPVEIIFGGDMLFDRSIRLAMEREGENYPLSCIAELLRSADIVVANLEGPITSHPSKSAYSKIGEPDNFTFTFPTSTAALLARHNIRLVNLGNNHIMNFGRDGFEQTKKILDESSVAYFGDVAGESVVYRTVLRGVELTFFNYNEFDVGEDYSNILQNIGIARGNGQLPIVYAHWGDEYVPPPARVKELARSFVDAGAEAVIGSHPHIVQESEFYLGKYIYYSLGNMVFDQYWDESVRRGLLIRVSFTREGIGVVEEIPIENQTDRRTCAV